MNYENQIDENWPIEARFLMKKMIKSYEAEIVQERFKREQIEERYISLSNLIEKVLLVVKTMTSYRKWRKNRKFIFNEINFLEGQVEKLRTHCLENDMIDYG